MTLQITIERLTEPSIWWTGIRYGAEPQHVRWCDCAFGVFSLSIITKP